MSESPDSSAPYGLYAHVPFCAQKCDYCAFYSHALDRRLVERYVAALLREMDLTLPAAAPETIFFGGGTPTLLTLPQWERILARLRSSFPSGVGEWTVECNPATLSFEKAALLRAGGVNRVSMGVQSLNADLLERLGRSHSREDVFRSFDILRSAGFDNINIDLMFALPGQTLNHWDETLDEALALGCEHLSCYEVIYEEETPLFEQMRNGEIKVDEDLAAAMFERLVEKAESGGWRQYEIANFARGEAGESIPRRACRHNVNYWRGGDYLSLGPSAVEYRSGLRGKNVSNTTLYCQRLENHIRPVEWTEHLPPLARAGETAAFGLRMNAGWPYQLFFERTGFDLRVEWASELRELVVQGLGVANENSFHLTPRGLRFADAAGAMFLRPENQPSAVAEEASPRANRRSH